MTKHLEDKLGSWRAAALALVGLVALDGSGCSSGGAPRGNVGVACTGADGECLDGLSCGTSGTAKGMCTAQCVQHPNPDDCATQFNTDSVCAADGQCVLSCLTVDRCYDGTFCDHAPALTFCRKNGTKG